MSTAKITEALRQLEDAQRIGAWGYNVNAEHPWMVYMASETHLYSTREVEAFLVGSQTVGK